MGMLDLEYPRAVRRMKTVIAVIVVCLTLAITGGAASATTTPTHATDTASSAPKPTVVLVHGAFADSSGWNATISQLQQAGYPVFAVPDPLRGLTADADYVRAFLQSVTGPIVLVGHSYGGAVITNAARGVPNVAALVYVGAFMPNEGESIATVLNPEQFPGSLLGPQTTAVRPVPNPSAPGGQDGDIYIAIGAFRSVFAGDVSQQQADLMARTQRPLSLTANFEPSGAPAWKTIPSWYLVTEQDKAIPPAGQEYMAKRAGAHISTVDSAHDVMVSHPAAVTKIILRAAKAVS